MKEPSRACVEVLSRNHARLVASLCASLQNGGFTETMTPEVLWPLLFGRVNLASEVSKTAQQRQRTQDSSCKASAEVQQCRSASQLQRPSGGWQRRNAPFSLVARSELSRWRSDRIGRTLSERPGPEVATSCGTTVRPSAYRQPPDQVSQRAYGLYGPNANGSTRYAQPG